MPLLIGAVAAENTVPEVGRRADARNAEDRDSMVGVFIPLSVPREKTESDGRNPEKSKSTNNV